jgi:acyl dehydratase
VSLIAAGRTYAGALESAAELVRGDERAYGYSTELQRSAVPVLAAAAVLAHRHGLSGAGLRSRLLGAEGGLDPLVAAADDDEARTAAADLRRFLADADLASNAHRNLVLTEAASMLLREPVTHEISQYGRTVVVDEQDVVYRGPSGPLPDATGPEVAAAPGEWEIETSPTLLFRFSALTYNGHRIHYDRDFARAEGYPGLVVHGPLQALAMAWSLRPRGQGTFSYRLLAPLCEGQGLRVSTAPDGSAAVRDRTARQTATAHWTPTDP